MLQSTGLQRIGHDWATEREQQQQKKRSCPRFIIYVERAAVDISALLLIHSVLSPSSLSFCTPPPLLKISALRGPSRIQIQCYTFSPVNRLSGIGLIGPQSSTELCVTSICLSFLVCKRG